MYSVQLENEVSRKGVADMTQVGVLGPTSTLCLAIIDLSTRVVVILSPLGASHAMATEYSPLDSPLASETHVQTDTNHSVTTGHNTGVFKLRQSHMRMVGSSSKPPVDVGSLQAARI